MSRKVDKAKERASHAAGQVEEWEARAVQLDADLAAAEASVGSQALESGDVEGTAASITALREEGRVARATVDAARAGAEKAAHEVAEAEANDLLKKADKLDKKADQHEAKTAELLGALQEHEGGPYEPAQPPMSDGLTASDRKLWTPRSEQLRIEATRCREQAAHLMEPVELVRG